MWKIKQTYRDFLTQEFQNRNMANGQREFVAKENSHIQNNNESKRMRNLIKRQMSVSNVDVDK
jgi:hypothetical protein